MRRAFTIIELMMVITVIAILLGITVTSMTGALKTARTNRANAIVTLVSQGIATYYAQYEEWPVEPGEGDDSNNGDYEYTASEVRETVKKLVEKAKEGNPVMDISGLFVSRQNGESDQQHGMDFMTAIRGTKENRRKMKVAEMYFGYPEKEHGYFRRLHIIYHPSTDSVEVTQ